MQLEARRRDVDPADPLARLGIGRNVGGTQPAREPARKLVGARGEAADVLAALREQPELRGEPVERRRELARGVGERRLCEHDVARELAGQLARREPQLAHRGDDARRGVGQRRNVAELRAGEHLGVPREVGDLSRGGGLAEEQRRGVRELVGLVEDHRVARGQELGQALVAQHHVREEQVMVDDDDVRGHRVGARLHHEAVTEVRAVRAEAVLARRRDQRPYRGVLGDVGEQGAVPPVGGAREGDDLAEVPCVFARGHAVVARRALEVVVADVVATTLEHRDRHRHAERIAHHRQVALEQLVLERLGAGRHDHLAAVHQRRHQVGESLAGAGAGLGDEPPARSDCGRNRTGHLDLLVAHPEAGHCTGERATLAEDRIERRVFGLRRLRQERGRGRGQRGAFSGAFVARPRPEGLARLPASPRYWRIEATRSSIEA